MKHGIKALHTHILAKAEYQTVSFVVVVRMTMVGLKRAPGLNILVKVIYFFKVIV